jgi:hypothetical protein
MRSLKLILIMSVFVSSCFPDFSPKKAYIKTIESEYMYIEWFTFLGVMDQEFPDYIVYKSNDLVDTLLVSNNVADIQLNLIEDNLKISFYGAPKLMKNSDFKRSTLNIPLIVDTLAKKKESQRRYFFND